MNKLIFLILFSIFVVSSRSSSQTLHPPPVPYFVITGLCFGDTTHFINKTTTSLISSQWNILNDKGDTIYHSEDIDIHFYFKKRGFYTICLTANNGHIVTKERMVNVDTVTKANFAFRPCYDEFDNQSACGDQFVWVLPDQSTSTAVYPSYTFSAPGKYPVKLIAKKGNKADTLLKQITITGDSVGLPSGLFTCKRLSADSTFEFTAVEISANAYSWYFGDGQGDDTSGYKVVHRIKGTYMPPVNLFVTNGCGIGIDLLDPFVVTGIEEEKSSALRLTVFPNPVKDELQIAISNMPVGDYAIVNLMDANGKVLKETKLFNATDSANFKYDVHTLSSGIYLLQIKTGEQVLTRKFIVK